MNRKHLIVAFVAGCATSALAAWMVVGLRAQDAGDNDVSVIHVCAAPGNVLRTIDLNASCPSPSQSMFFRKAGRPPAQPAPTAAATDARIRSLQQRIAILEQQATRTRLATRVTAPLEVIDRNGRPVFSVGEDRVVRLYNTAGKDVVRLEAGDSGGYLLASNNAGTLSTAIGAVESEANVKVVEGGIVRTELGSSKSASGIYRVAFYSKDGTKGIARLGATSTGDGNALVLDAAGNVRAGMMLEEHHGLVFVQNNGGQAVSKLTEGSRADGLLKISSANGTPMVDAGITEGGFGVVRTGPGSFMMAAGVGLPGSFIMGKAK